jgi:hypothetical protein
MPDRMRPCPSPPPYGKVDKARQRLTAAEREAAAVVHAATAHVPLTELATLTGIPPTDLRRLSRVSTTTEPEAEPGPTSTRLAAPDNPPSDPTPTAG